MKKSGLGLTPCLHSADPCHSPEHCRTLQESVISTAAGDFSVFDEDGLVFEGSGARAVDDADVGEEDLWGVDFDVLEDFGGEGGGLGLEGSGGSGQGGEQGRS